MEVTADSGDFSSRCSSDQLADDTRRLDPRKPLIQSLVTECKTLVIEPKQSHHRRMEIVDMHRVLDDVVGKIIRFAVDSARLGTAARHPHRETSWMMVAPVIVLAQSA